VLAPARGMGLRHVKELHLYAQGGVGGMRERVLLDRPAAQRSANRPSAEVSVATRLSHPEGSHAHPWAHEPCSTLLPKSLK
jgi:hypothetical protein